jgi:hypothetical protein
MLVSVTFPQFVNIPVMAWIWPATTVVQSLVTEAQGASVTTQTFVAAAVTRVPQMLLAEAVTMLVKLPHVLFVTSLL